MIKRTFLMPLRALQELINAGFKLTQLLLSCPHYSCINKQAKTINIAFKTKIKETIPRLAINSRRSKSTMTKNKKSRSMVLVGNSEFGASYV
ncbi:Mobile element protein [Candidatus Enterovibrio altilux]|uniref:Mobile element protein n=1 Tax=Candidatus Enterovibrio altilux TaxID=1927128 RepID=A0A291B799_9GAMM|nr:Mobile element protein [Candidatus Enterovibrio luxaltus]